MAISPLSAARTMCEVRDWQISNLELQKLLYIAEMAALGRSNGAEPLVTDVFQAWDYGPVLPSVYHRAKAFGDKHVPDVFHIADLAVGRDRNIIEQVAKNFEGYSAAELVDITHWDRGAWASHYIPGVKGIVIPRADILREYRERIG
jgi:uncharacterized phage-associated protein